MAIAVTRVTGSDDPLFSWIRGIYWRLIANGHPWTHAPVATSITGAVAGDDWLNGLRQGKLASVRRKADSD